MDIEGIENAHLRNLIRVRRRKRDNDERPHSEAAKRGGEPIAVHNRLVRCWASCRGAPLQQLGRRCHTGNPFTEILVYCALHLLTGKLLHLSGSIQSSICHSIARHL